MHQKEILFVFLKTMSKSIFQVFLMPEGEKKCFFATSMIYCRYKKVVFQ